MKTLRNLLAFIIVFLSAATIVFATDYRIDVKESQVKWTGKKVTGQHYGTINVKQGSLTADGNIISASNVEIDMNTISNKDLENESWNSRLVGHLKSDDFFSVEKYPVSSLALGKVENLGGNQFRFTGNLTIKGTTHPVTFDAKVDVTNGQLVAEGAIKVDRTLYDIRYGSGKFFDSLGNNMIDDFFTLDFKLVAKEKAPGLTLAE